MLYQHSLDIERRLDDVLALIRAGRFSTARLAEQVGVSVPTISRDVTALRERGHDIRAQRSANGWRFYLMAEPAPPTDRGSRLAAVRQ